MEPVETETVQDKRMKATFLKKILVITIAAAWLSRRTEKARSKSFAVLAAMGDWHCMMGDGNRVKVISITAGVEYYTGESGREKIIPPVQDFSSHVTAYLSQGDEEDAACLNLRVMGEQSKMLKACLIHKAMEVQIVVEKYKALEEGESATGRYIPKIRILSSSVKQLTHHKRFTMHESNTYQRDVTIGTCQEDRSCAKNVVLMVQYESVMSARVEDRSGTPLSRTRVSETRDSSKYRDVEEVLAEQMMSLESLSSYQGRKEYEVAEHRGVEQYIGPVEKIKKEIKSDDTSSKLGHLKMLKNRIFRPFLPGCTGLPSSGQLIPARRLL